MSLPVWSESPEAFRQAFGQGLLDMLARHDDFGVYILALANATNDSVLWPQLERLLTERHYHLGALTSVGLRQGRRIDAPEDDLAVFLKLMAIGFEHLGRLETRRAGPWEVQFNPLRALRPPRNSGLRVDGLRKPFNPEGFHFDKPFLAREIFWQGALLERPVALLYNKFPFAPLHGLLVPDKAAGLPQWLTPAWHDYAWRLTETLGAHLPGFGLAYNSLGAQASVNHLHFQTFLSIEPLPLQHPDWQHNGGATVYPSACTVFTSAREAWCHLDELHQRQAAYNLVYLPGRVYVLPRRHQGDHPVPAWISGHAWYEMAGGVTTFNREDYERLTETDIAQALAHVGLR